MRARSKSVAAIPVVCAVVVALSGCAPTTQAPRIQRVSIPVGEERAAVLQLEMGSGDVTVTGGGTALVEGTLTYAASSQKPHVADAVATSVAGAVHTVGLVQSAGHLASDAKARIADAWDVVLGGGLPTDVMATTGGGTATLDLSLVDVKDLSGSFQGATVLKLGGPHPSFSKVDISATNLKADLTGEYPALENFTVNVGAGRGVLDMSGPWHHPLTAFVKAKGGTVEIVLPRTANVSIDRGRGSGRAEVPPEIERKVHGNWLFTPAKPTKDSLTIKLDLGGGTAKISLAPKR